MQGPNSFKPVWLHTKPRAAQTGILSQPDQRPGSLGWQIRLISDAGPRGDQSQNTNLMDDDELLEKAQLLLGKCPLSGASIEKLESILADGFADDGFYGWENREAETTGREQRRAIRELCILHQI